MDLSAIRNEYTKYALEREDLADCPFAQFEKWMKQAINAKLTEPTAMTIATVGETTAPSLRTVLLKHYDENGFIFFTNYNSRKAREMNHNKEVALLFPWLELERQVICTAEKTSMTENVKYFASRPKDSQLGAWASPQSSIIESRKFLEIQIQKMKEKFQHGEIPLPDFWGGYRITPRTIEFWQGGKSRLHDRFQYTKEKGIWTIERLAP